MPEIITVFIVFAVIFVICALSWRFIYRTRKLNRGRNTSTLVDRIIKLSDMVSEKVPTEYVFRINPPVETPKIESAKKKRPDRNRGRKGIKSKPTPQKGRRHVSYSCAAWKIRRNRELKGQV